MRILVPFDRSDCSRAAVEYAASLASRTNASIDLLYVWEPRSFVAAETFVDTTHGSSEGLVEFSRTPMGREMDRVLDELRGRHLQVLGRIDSADAAAAIVRAAKEHDLIVMGTHGRHGAAHFVLGSIAERVLRDAPCPVVTVRAQTPEGRAA